MTIGNASVGPAFDDFDDGWFGRAAVIAPEPVASEPPAPEPIAVEPEPIAVEPEPAPRFESPAEVDYVPTRRHGFVAAPPRPSWESRISDSGAWDFKPASSPAPWYRSRFAAIAALVIVAAAVAGGVSMLFRGPFASGPESSTQAPAAPPAPVPAGPAPAVSAPAVAPPPGPPPPALPPPPSAQEMTPPVADRQYSPGYRTSDDARKPQLNVTRAPLSATPPPPPPPDRNSATPGDGRRRHGGFGW